MQDKADMVTNSSYVEVCLEEPPGSMCAKPYCPPVSTTFLLFLLHLVVLLCPDISKCKILHFEV